MIVDSHASSYWSIPEMANIIHYHTIERARRLADDLKVVRPDITFHLHKKRLRSADVCTLLVVAMDSSLLET